MTESQPSKCSVACIFSSLTSVKLIFFYFPIKPLIFHRLMLFHHRMLFLHARTLGYHVNLRQNRWQARVWGTPQRPLIYRWWRISWPLLICMEEANLLKNSVSPKLSLNYAQSLAGNLSQLLPVHRLTDAGWPGFPYAVPSCGKTQVFAVFPPKALLLQGLEALMLEELCSKVSGRPTNP